jgi:hypothetical protein
MNVRTIAVLLLLNLAFTICLKAQAPATAQAVINRMYDMYKGKWYKTLSFSQQTGFYKDGKLDRTETWYEAMKLDRGLIIKFGSKESDDGIVFKNDSQFVYHDNVIVNKKRLVHDLLVLGFTVYTETPLQTIEKLKESDFDMDKLSEEKINGVLHYVIGDPAKGQFWIESKNLLFTKLRKIKNDVVTEITFDKYRKLGNGWIEQEVMVYRNGVIIMSEVYDNIQIPKLDDSLYTFDNFSNVRW